MTKGSTFSKVIFMVTLSLHLSSTLRTKYFQELGKLSNCSENLRMYEISRIGSDFLFNLERFSNGEYFVSQTS